MRWILEYAPGNQPGWVAPLAHAALSFIHKSGVTYPVAVDPMQTSTAYNVPGLPATFFLNARHTIVKRVFGPVTKAALSSGASLMAQRAG